MILPFFGSIYILFKKNKKPLLFGFLLLVIGIVMYDIFSGHDDSDDEYDSEHDYSDDETNDEGKLSNNALDLIQSGGDLSKTSDDNDDSGLKESYCPGKCRRRRCVRRYRRYRVRQRCYWRWWRRICRPSHHAMRRYRRLNRYAGRCRRYRYYCDWRCKRRAHPCYGRNKVYCKNRCRHKRRWNHEVCYQKCCLHPGGRPGG